MNKQNFIKIKHLKKYIMHVYISHGGLFKLGRSILNLPYQIKTAIKCKFALIPKSHIMPKLKYEIYSGTKSSHSIILGCAQLIMNLCGQILAR